MAKPTTQKIKLESTAGTGYYYVTKKNSRTLTEKLVLKKYDPVAKKHVEFKETKIKSGAPSAPDAVTRRRATRLPGKAQSVSRRVSGQPRNHSAAG